MSEMFEKKTQWYSGSRYQRLRDGITFKIMSKTKNDYLNELVLIAFEIDRKGELQDQVNYPPTQSDGMGFKPKNECT